mmetsp:Transcript_25045/g.53218  ORF Transcript_25045/g.53218 Transcript_25045/m.53218 type:complete len:96 (+) Transcript_25045:1095-1382(+)
MEPQSQRLVALLSAQEEDDALSPESSQFQVQTQSPSLSLSFRSPVLSAQQQQQEGNADANVGGRNRGGEQTRYQSTPQEKSNEIRLLPPCSFRTP